jgi:hypothetical protein
MHRFCVKTQQCLVILYGCRTRSRLLRERHKWLRRRLRKMLTRGEVPEHRELHCEEFLAVYVLSSIGIAPRS